MYPKNANKGIFKGCVYVRACVCDPGHPGHPGHPGVPVVPGVKMVYYMGSVLPP